MIEMEVGGMRGEGKERGHRDGEGEGTQRWGKEMEGRRDVGVESTLLFPYPLLKFPVFLPIPTSPPPPSYSHILLPPTPTSQSPPPLIISFYLPPPLPLPLHSPSPLTLLSLCPSTPPPPPSTSPPPPIQWFPPASYSSGFRSRVSSLLAAVPVTAHTTPTLPAHTDNPPNHAYTPSPHRQPHTNHAHATPTLPAHTLQSFIN
ncbi:hypothetical protein Pcinc_029546 [Petrolisthes cinctipes]|uniref:Uncharacterized protein n=1 Tax=Petrolisthes cinctipes TaxID=88211 RepID=A0AAE1K7C2_PETCI|nr:hypothetical protein Pcinc_029546 [Petrolisthes cinctipes]